jgi:transposase
MCGIGEVCDLESRHEVGGSMQVAGTASGARRRRWSADEKARIVAETFAPGATVAAVAGKHAIASNLLFAWRREASLQEHGAAAVGGLVPVHVAAPAPTTGMKGLGNEALPRATRSTAKKTGLIEIDRGGGKRVRVDADVDADALGRVLDVLERR